MTRPRTHSRLRDERGSLTIELTILAPGIILLIMMCVAGGRYAVARQSVEAAAASAARAGSIARDPGTAQGDAQTNAAATLSNEHRYCVNLGTSVDTSAFSLPVGTPGTVRATVQCTLDMSDVSLPGMPGSITITSTQSSPLDTYRGR